MNTVLFLVFALIIYSYYAYVWTRIAGTDKAKNLFGITGFLITLVTHWLLGFLLHNSVGYFVEYCRPNAFISHYFPQIIAALTLIILIFTSEQYALLLKRKFGRIFNEVENIGRHHE